MKTNINSLFKCSRCELNFLSKEGMEKHSMRVHEGKGIPTTRFKCDKCDAEFDTKQDFKKHKVPQRFPCDGCKKKGQVFFAENKCEFTKHLKFFDYHKNEDVKNRNLITCLKCKLEFKNSQLLKIHKDHTGKVSCKKPNCGKVFFGTCKLEKHKKFDDHTHYNSSASKPKPSPIIKPAVINLEKLESKEGKAVDNNTMKRKATSSGIAGAIFKKPEPKSNHPVTTKNDKEDNLIADNKGIQKKVQNIEEKIDLLSNIQFHYPTFTEQQLQEQGVFDELSSSYFLPPFIADDGGDDIGEQLLVTEQEDVILEDVFLPEAFDGVCILGF